MLLAVAVIYSSLVIYFSVKHDFSTVDFEKLPTAFKYLLKNLNSEGMDVGQPPLSNLSGYGPGYKYLQRVAT